MTVERRNAPALAAPSGYSHVALGTGRVVYTSGAVPVDADERLVGAGDHAAQARQVIDNLLTALETAGASPADVLKTTVYVVGDRSKLLEVWEVLTASPLAGAASTLLGVGALAYDGQLVEIDAFAIIG